MVCGALSEEVAPHHQLVGSPTGHESWITNGGVAASQSMEADLNPKVRAPRAGSGPTLKLLGSSTQVNRP